MSEDRTPGAEAVGETAETSGNGSRVQPSLSAADINALADTILAKVREQGRASSSPSATETPPSSARKN